MRAIARLVDEAGSDKAPFVADDIAAAFCLHPATGTDIVGKAVEAVRLHGLVEGMEALEITDRHVHAVTGELARWQLTPEQAQHVVTQVLTRTRSWVAAGRGRRSWPTPGELKRKIRTAVLVHDAEAAKKAREKAKHDRSAELWQSAVGEGTVSITGPDAQLLRIWAAIEARAESLGELPGDERTQQQRLFDAAEELLCHDADAPASGAFSAVPGHAEGAAVVPLWVRGVRLQLVVPYSISRGLDVEVAEVPGHGPVLPATARELMCGVESVQRVAVDGDSGAVVGVDDRVPVPPVVGAGETPLPLLAPESADAPPSAPACPSSDPPDDGEPDGADMSRSSDTADSSGPWRERLSAARRRLDETAPRVDPPAATELPQPEIPAHVLSTLERIVIRALPRTPPAEHHYRPSERLARHVNARDRTCAFPGCPRPAASCDRDHRVAYPDGPTGESNLHALCRRHHRAKQFYFEVTLDPEAGDTVWRTPDGREYRRPPPVY